MAPKKRIDEKYRSKKITLPPDLHSKISYWPRGALSTIIRWLVSEIDTVKIDDETGEYILITNEREHIFLPKG